MPRPLSLRSTCSSLDGWGNSSMVIKSLDESYSVTSPITSPTIQSDRRKSDEFTRWKRRLSHTHRRLPSLPYVTDSTSRRTSIQSDFLLEHEQTKENQLGKLALRSLFDPDDDGVVWPSNTFRATRKMGFGRFSGLIISFSCHFLFSYPLQFRNKSNKCKLSKWIPDPCMRVQLVDIEEFHGTQRGRESHALLEKYGSSIRYYSRLYRLHKVDFLDGIAIALEMRHTFSFGSILLFLFVWLFLRIGLPRRGGGGKTNVEDIVNALDGTYFYTWAMQAKLSHFDKAHFARPRTPSTSSKVHIVASSETFDFSPH